MQPKVSVWASKHMARSTLPSSRLRGTVQRRAGSRPRPWLRSPCLTLRSSGQSTAGHVCLLRRGQSRRCLPLTYDVRLLRKCVRCLPLALMLSWLRRLRWRSAWAVRPLAAGAPVGSREGARRHCHVPWPSALMAYTAVRLRSVPGQHFSAVCVHFGLSGGGSHS